MVAHNCGCNYLGKWGKRVIWTQGFKPPWAMHYKLQPCLNKQPSNEWTNEPGIDGENESGASRTWKVWTECEHTLLIPGQLLQWGLSQGGGGGRSVIVELLCIIVARDPRPGWWHFDKGLIKLSCLGIVSHDRSCPLAFTRVHLPHLHPFLFLF